LLYLYKREKKCNKKKGERKKKGQGSERLILIDMTVGRCHGDVTPLKSSCSSSSSRNKIKRTFGDGRGFLYSIVSIRRKRNCVTEWSDM
jgi:hypothetical protein